MYPILPLPNQRRITLRAREVVGVPNFPHRLQHLPDDRRIATRTLWRKCRNEIVLAIGIAIFPFVHWLCSEVFLADMAFDMVFVPGVSKSLEVWSVNYFFAAVACYGTHSREKDEPGKGSRRGGEGREQHPNGTRE
jgi:hypothetical protein